MDIYGVIYSPYAARVVLTARIKGVKHKLLTPKDGLKSPSFLKLNPLGKVPVLKDGTTVLFESAVIVEYLDAKYKKKPLVPKAAKAGAEARLTGALFSEYLQPATLALWAQLDPAKRDQAVVDAKVVEIGRMLDIIEMRMGSKYCAGTKLTIADVYAAPVMFYLLTLLPMVGVADPLKGRKKLAKYAALLRKDKVLGSVLGDMDAGFKKVMGG